jgi:ADP-dependent NAD(P)H-hydrate dehydratase / NAD(P)H-hydrate epimerase
MKLLTSSRMRELDRRAIEDIGIPGIVLMENASRGVFDIIRSEFGLLECASAAVVCGKGNNGGDGFAVARHLHNAGARPRIAVAARPGEISGDAAINMNACKNLNIPMIHVTDPRRMAGLRKILKGADFVVDALLGTGVSGPVKPFFLKIINEINKCDSPVFAVDVPSGVQVDDGRVFNGAVNADHTITFGAPKIGLFVHPGASHAGSIYVIDIGIPTEFLDAEEAGVFLTTKKYIEKRIVERPATAHKGDCGRLIVVGGSSGMSGAPCLTGMSALRTGAGLVYLAVPKSLLTVVGRKFIEAVTLPQSEDRRGRLSLSSADEILERLKTADAMALGPGLGVSDETCELVYRLIEESPVPALIDADALNCIAKEPDILKSAKSPLVLTPHPGEMARLAGIKISEVQAARLDTAREFAKENKVVLVLKGAHSIVASPDGFAFVNTTGNSGMATAGSGDVLSGIGGALLAEGMRPFDAAVCAVFIHGLAGDMAARKMPSRSITASDILKFIPKAIQEAEEES